MYRESFWYVNIIRYEYGILHLLNVHALNTVLSKGSKPIDSPFGTMGSESGCPWFRLFGSISVHHFADYIFSHSSFRKNIFHKHLRRDPIYFAQTSFREHR